MNQNSLAALLPSLLTELEGKPGFWRGIRHCDGAWYDVHPRLRW